MRRIAFLLLFLLACTPQGGPGHGSGAREFDQFAREVFAPIYPLLAQQILEDTGISEGHCLDIGSGGGYLGIEIARMSGMKVVLGDIDRAALRIADRNLKEAGLRRQVSTRYANVQSLPFADKSFDLVVSRGSFLFWEDKKLAFSEIARVLKKGGAAYIGGGMGRRMPKEARSSIKEEMKIRGIGPEGVSKLSPEEMESILKEAGIRNFKILGDGPQDFTCKCGMWVQFDGFERM
ncbi:MAG: class I SAM-dependent methyltransferase [Candidatus Krumholzibacteria bacterium]|jgi:SAM-dependent methyltransferase|nr:class I SAM-dependent methyltransferase [Candidatus Krumholzibacteria bacterium]MDP6669141.1 class I SAM-dependent methyltransferase [Candidatus Krumholzibacteria bacterium]MDP6797542.1 class I SAM-dependent methyltransferase [Candidatus Krumholzibacteria bacterium]MDP7021313.1 class I SAM-dependent methyltransferase [Candidatus Krumholzibacteria bacterium]